MTPTTPSMTYPAGRGHAPRGLLAAFVSVLAGFSRTLPNRIAADLPPRNAARTARAEPGTDVYVPAPSGRALLVYRATPADGELRLVRTIAGPHTGLDAPGKTAVDPSGRLYVVNAGGRSVTVYAPGADGDARPVRTIAGPRTKLRSPCGVAIDAGGAIYVGESEGDRVLVYAPGADGDVAPSRIVQGSRTGLFGVQGVAVDRAGCVYVADDVGVIVYAPGADGNVAPLRTVGLPVTGVDNLDVGQPVDLALGRADTLYVSTFAGRLAVYAPGASGPTAPVRRIAGARTGLSVPTSLAVDARGFVYALNWGAPPRLAAYAPSATGDVAPVRSVPLPPNGLAADGRTARAEEPAGRHASSSVTVYAPDARGDAPPVRTIAGPHTGIGLAVGAAVSPSGELYVLSCDGAISVFAPGASGDATPARTRAGVGMERLRRRNPAPSVGIALGPLGRVYVAGATYWGGGRSWVLVYGPDLGAELGRVAYDHEVSGALVVDQRGSAYAAMSSSVHRYAAAAPNEEPVDSIEGPATELYRVRGLAVDARGTIYTANRDDAIRIYAPGASGDVRPVRVIAGPRTQLEAPTALAFDGSGRLYVANHPAPAGASIAVYAPGVDGNVAPVRTLAGPRTGLRVPRAVALDARGNLYVVNTPADVSACFAGPV